jgi:ketosteroid isomerase-like protein
VLERRQILLWQAHDLCRPKAALPEGVQVMRRALCAAGFLAASVAMSSVGGCKGPDPVPPPATPSAATSTAPSSTPNASVTAPPAADAGASQDRPTRQSAWLRSYVEAFNRHDAAALAKLYTPDASYVELSSEGGESKGTEAIEKDYATLFAGFVDVKMSITRSWHVNDVVAFEFVEGGTGTANDDSEKLFGITGAHLLWFADDGRVKRDQIYEDDLTVSNQLGWGEPPVSKIPVRPVRDVPAFDGTWERNVANGSAEEAKGASVREGLYTKLLTPNAEKDFLATVTDDIVMAEFDDPADAVGKKAVSEVFKNWHKTFSNMRIEATHAWPCGPYVIFEGVFSGKQSGPWGPMKPTNREFVSHFLDVTRVKEGKVDRLWTYASSSEILGLHDTPKAAPANKR